ncbi:hypothetical protein HELRODRAFT_192463 [Helobdella robusta]|uniref:Polycystin cation channel PKD1/PKD2 domain-containing protein n=1 Tax=Helobdella robusta TaxID=6412 RepID=T1FTZ6_HELRO|nr:hypothetical protein HELRODRAFT_192463 [Helobdella robusta]ESO00887.1 hypothetical protein HELRODRAFT_192463 [Helobdella robusta]
MPIDRSSSVSSGSTWGDEFEVGNVRPAGSPIDEIIVENDDRQVRDPGQHGADSGGEDGGDCCFGGKIKWCCLKGLSLIRKIWATNQMEDTKNNKDTRMRLLIRELVIYVIFLFFVTFVTFSKTSPTDFYFSRTLAMTFLDSPVHPSDPFVTFKNMKVIKHWYQFSQGPLLNGLYPDNMVPVTKIPETDKSGLPTPTTTSSSLTTPSSSSTPPPSSSSTPPPSSSSSPQSSSTSEIPGYKPFGVARLRLVRSLNGSCKVSKQLYASTYNSGIDSNGGGGSTGKGSTNDGYPCYQGYSYSAEDRTIYGPDHSNAWFYQSADQLGSSLSSFSGRIATYSEGGYVHDLNTTYEYSKYDLENLERYDWLEYGPTRAVFIDFSLYNANIDLLCIVRLLTEFPVCGGMVSSWHMKSVKLLRYGTAFEFVQLAFEIIVVIFLIYFAIEEVIEIYRLRCGYWRSFFNVNDVIIVLLLVTCLVLTILKTTRLNDTILNNYNNNNNFDNNNNNNNNNNGSRGSDDGFLTTTTRSSSGSRSSSSTTTFSGSNGIGFNVPTTNSTKTNNNINITPTTTSSSSNNNNTYNDTRNSNGNYGGDGNIYGYNVLSHHVDLNSLAELEGIYMGFMAVTLFCCWIKLFKFIGLTRTMTQLSMTLSSCLSEIVTFTFIFTLVYVSFALLAYFLFGSTVPGFNTFEGALYSQFKILLGDFNYDSILSTNSVLGPAYFIIVIFILLILLAGMFVAIISDAYGNVKMELLQKRRDLELMDYIKKAYRKMLDKIDLKRRRNTKDATEAMNIAGVTSSHAKEAGKRENPKFGESRFNRTNDDDVIIARNGDGDNKLRATNNSFDGESVEDDDDDDDDYSLSNHHHHHHHNRQQQQQQPQQQHRRHHQQQHHHRDRNLHPTTMATIGQRLINHRKRRSNNNNNMINNNMNNNNIVGGGASGGVGHEEFSMLQRRVDRMEHSIGSVVSKIDAVLVKLETMERLRSLNKEAVTRLLNSVTESEGALSEDFRNECLERLVCSDLAGVHWDSSSGISGGGGPSPVSSRDHHQNHHHNYNNDNNNNE